MLLDFAEAPSPPLVRGGLETGYYVSEMTTTPAVSFTLVAT